MSTEDLASPSDRADRASPQAASRLGHSAAIPDAGCAGLDILRTPFPDHQISKLPKETKAQAEARKNNREGVNCTICGGWHHPRAVHLDYVGHAALTDRLLDADIGWSWEPVAFNQEGLPAFDLNGGLWIRLTVSGVTRLGYGAADGKQGGDAVKEIIGDALRNAAMRFGAALDLWHKGDLHVDPDEPVAVENEPTAMIADSDRDLIQTLAPAAGKTVQGICEAYKVASLKELTAKQAGSVIARLKAAEPKSDVIDDDIPY